MRVRDLAGQTFGRLTVINRAANNDHHGHVRWECMCICGTSTIVAGCNLTSGHIQGCGCLEHAPRHGQATREQGRSAEYRTWVSIKGRCLNAADKGFRNYGGRGITVCERWQNSFENFFADMGRRPPGMRGKIPLYSL